MRKTKQKKDIGAIGIGTLIVFIALILVAAIAAAVIIGTAEDLEERAEEASDDAKTMIQQVPRIIRAQGTVAASGNIDVVDIYIDYIGNDGVDMRNVVVHVLATPNNGVATRADLTINIANLGSADSQFFGVTEIADPLGHWDTTTSPPRYIIGEGTLLRLSLNLQSAASSLPPDSDLRIEITSSDSGSKTIDEWVTPAAYPQANSIVNLEN
jgi:archaellin